MKRSDPADAPPVWLSTAQATALLGVSARTIYGLVNRGALPASGAPIWTTTWQTSD